MKNGLQRPGFSILTRQTVSYLLIILVITATFGLFFFSTAKNHLEREVGRKLQDIASIAARNAPFERLNLIKIGDDRTRMVLRLKEKLGEIKEATGVQNIFIFSPELKSLIDLKPDRPIGTEYRLPHFQPRFISRLESKKAVSTGSYRVASNELYISAYAPVMNSKGELFAIVGVDAGTREVEVIERMRTRIYLIAAVGVILGFVLALILARTLTRPISEMAQTAKRLGKGDYQARATLPPTSELRVLADSMNQMASQVQERDKQLKEMSATVAHEIRNPLNSIKLLTTLLDEKLDDLKGDKPTETIETIHYEIGKLNRFLTEFLTYSRPMTLVRNRISPCRLADSAVEMARAEAQAKQVEIHTSYENDIREVLVDRDRLEQTLLNIILNAVFACEVGGRVDLEVKESSDGQGVEFITKDSGSGMDEHVLEKLFEPFFTTKETGTGLGLSNASRIVSNHGGETRASNMAHGGAEFTVFIPFEPPAETEE